MNFGIGGGGPKFSEPDPVEPSPSALVDLTDTDLQNPSDFDTIVYNSALGRWIKARADVRDPISMAGSKSLRVVGDRTWNSPDSGYIDTIVDPVLGFVFSQPDPIKRLENFGDWVRVNSGQKNAWMSAQYPQERIEQNPLPAGAVLYQASGTRTTDNLRFEWGFGDLNITDAGANFALLHNHPLSVGFRREALRVNGMTLDQLDADPDWIVYNETGAFGVFSNLGLVSMAWELDYYDALPAETVTNAYPPHTGFGCFFISANAACSSAETGFHPLFSIGNESRFFSIGFDGVTKCLSVKNEATQFDTTIKLSTYDVVAVSFANSHVRIYQARNVDADNMSLVHQEAGFGCTAPVSGQMYLFATPEVGGGITNQTSSIQNLVVVDKQLTEDQIRAAMRNY